MIYENLIYTKSKNSKVKEIVKGAIQETLKEFREKMKAETVFQSNKNT